MCCATGGTRLVQGKANLPPNGGLCALQLEVGRVGRVRRVGLFQALELAWVRRAWGRGMLSDFGIGLG